MNVGCLGVWLRILGFKWWRVRKGCELDRDGVRCVFQKENFVVMSVKDFLVVFVLVLGEVQCLCDQFFFYLLYFEKFLNDVKKYLVYV